MSRSMLLPGRVPAALALAAVTLTFAVAAGAQSAADFPSAPPAPGPAPTLHIATPQQFTLANGLRVIVAERHGLPLVTTELLVRAGSETDPRDKAGLAALTADLLSKGAGGLGAPQVAAASEALGGSLDTSSGWDKSTIDISVTTPKLPAALKLMADAARHPQFAQAELDRARKQTLGDLRLTLAQPTGMASLLGARAIFGNGAYGHSRVGTPTSLPRITRADVQYQHATWYRPDNAILIFAGDIDLATARRLAGQAFGDWAKPSTALPQRPVGAGSSTAPALLVVNQPGAGQAGVVAGHVGIRRDAGDYYAGEMANAVLGGSYSARLNEEIRIKRGLSYGANSSLDSRRDSGAWMARVQTKNPSAAQVVDLIQTEFGKLADTPVGSAELAARKATLIGGYGRSLETTAGLASQVADLALYGIDLAEISRAIAHVQAVTPTQIQAFAKAHLGAAGTHVVVVGDAVQFAPALKKAHPGLVQVDADKVDLGD